MSGDVFFRRSPGGGVDCDGDAVDDLNTGFIRKSVRWEDQQQGRGVDNYTDLDSDLEDEKTLVVDASNESSDFSASSTDFSTESEEERFEAVDGGPTKIEAKSQQTNAKDGQLPVAGDKDCAEVVHLYDAFSSEDDDNETDGVMGGFGPVQIRKPRTTHKSPADRLHLAVWKNNPDLVHHLVFRQGVFIDCFNVMGQTPLFVAAYTRKRRVTTTLLSLGADPNVRCLGGQTAVHAACHSGSVSLLATLLKYGGDLYIHDVHRQIPTDWITDQADEKRRIRILDFLESVRKCTTRKPHTTTSGGGPSSFLQGEDVIDGGKATRRSKTHLADLQEKAFAKPLEKSFTGRLLSEASLASLETYTAEKSLSSDSDCSLSAVLQRTSLSSGGCGSAASGWTGRLPSHENSDTGVPNVFNGKRFNTKKQQKSSTQGPGGANSSTHNAGSSRQQPSLRYLTPKYQGSSQSYGELRSAATKPNNPPASTLPDLATQKAAASKPVATAASISALKNSSRGWLRIARSFPHDLHGASSAVTPSPTNSAITSTAGEGSSNSFHTIASGFITDGNSPVLPSNGRTTLSKVRDLYARSGTGKACGGVYMSESSKHLHQQHTEARLFKERYKERFGPLQHTGRPSSTPLAKESRLLSKSYRKLDIKPASHFTRAESVGFAPQFAIPKTNFSEQQLNPDHPENRLPPPHHFPVGGYLDESLYTTAQSGAEINPGRSISNPHFTTAQSRIIVDTNEDSGNKTPPEKTAQIRNITRENREKRAAFLGGGEPATTSGNRPFVRMPLGSSDTAAPPAYKMMTSTPKEPSSGGGVSSLRPYKVKRDFRSGVVGSKLRLDDSKLDSFCSVDEAGDTIVGKDMDETAESATAKDFRGIQTSGEVPTSSPLNRDAPVNIFSSQPPPPNPPVSTGYRATVRSAIHAIESNFPAKNGIQGVSSKQPRSQQPNKATTFAVSAEVGKPPKIPADHQTKLRTVKAMKTTSSNNNNQVAVSKIDSWNNQVDAGGEMEFHTIASESEFLAMSAAGDMRGEEYDEDEEEEVFEEEGNVVEQQEVTPPPSSTSQVNVDEAIGWGSPIEGNQGENNVWGQNQGTEDQATQDWQTAQGSAWNTTQGQNDTWDTAQGQDANAWDTAQGQDANAWDTVQGQDGTAWDTAQGQDGNAWNTAQGQDGNAWDMAQGHDSNAWDTVQGQDGNAWDMAQGQDGNAWDTVQGQDGNAWDTAQGQDGNAWDTAQGQEGNAWDTAQGQDGNAWDTAQGQEGNAWDTAQGQDGNAWDTAQGQDGNAWDTVQEPTDDPWRNNQVGETSGAWDTANEEADMNDGGAFVDPQNLPGDQDLENNDYHHQQQPQDDADTTHAGENVVEEEDVWNNNNKKVEMDKEVEEEDVQDERWTTVADGNEEPSVMGGGETEDLYCDDELHPSLENDPNMQLSCAVEAAAAGRQPVNDETTVTEQTPTNQLWN